MSLPIVTVVGNLTGDPELKFTSAGKPYANINVAANERYQDKNTGEWKDGDTTFLRGTIWGSVAEQLPANLHKGTKVIVVGRLKQRDYETNAGEKRTAYELDVQEIGAALRPVKQQSSNGSVKSWPTTQPGSYGDDTPF